MTARSVVVTADLVAEMIGDLTIHVLTRPLRLTVLVLAAVVVIVGTLILIGDAVSGSSPDAFTVTIPIAYLALVVFLLAGAVRAIRRSVRTSYPVGATVSAEVDDDTLVLETPRASSRIRLTSYSGIRPARSVVVLRHAGSRVVSVLPRAVLTDADIEAVRRGIGSR